METLTPQQKTKYAEQLKVPEFKENHSWYVKHKPSGEDWHILGIDFDNDCVCISGWPSGIAQLSDCYNFEIVGPLSESELNHRKNRFGENWI